MHFFLDHLGAVVLAGIVLLIVASVGLRQQRSDVDAVGEYAGSTRTLGMISMIERDFGNMGSGVAPSDSVLLKWLWTDSLGVIEFRGRVDTSAFAPIKDIKYEFLPGANPTCTDLGVMCYEIRRYERAGGPYLLRGRSSPIVTKFDIDLRRETGLPVGANLDQTRTVDVSLTTLVSFSQGTSDERTHWLTRFRPANMINRGG
jgi:hypothetical protein